jgi:hypothetical protein
MQDAPKAQVPGRFPLGEQISAVATNSAKAATRSIVRALCSDHPNSMNRVELMLED